MRARGYMVPASLSQATRALAANSDARVLAGGQQLLIGQQPQAANSVLVDLRKITELAAINRQLEGGLQIGAMTTLAQIAGNDLVRAHCPALCTAARVMGDAQLRNRATLGGHFASADPDADIIAVVLALDADIVIAGPHRRRMVPAGQFFIGPNQTILEAGEVLVSADVPPRVVGSGVAYERFRHPATLYAMCGVAVNIALDSTGRVVSCFIAVTGAAEYPARVRAPEKILLGKQPDLSLIDAAAASATEALALRSDLFASAEYRGHLTRVLTARSIKQALASAAQDRSAQSPKARKVAPAA